MIKLIGKIPREKFYLCCSGGVDSMAMFKLLLKYPKNDFEVIYFNHGTIHGLEAQKFLEDFCQKNNKVLNVGHIERPKLKEESLEEYWRKCRYDYISNFKGKKILCHHLDDVVETWIFTSLRGQSKLIPYNGLHDCIRPMLLNTKDELIAFLKDFPYISDESNFEEDHARNIIRNSMMKDVLRVNPGIKTTIKKKLLTG